MAGKVGALHCIKHLDHSQPVRPGNKGRFVLADTVDKQLIDVRQYGFALRGIIVKIKVLDRAVRLFYDNRMIR